MSISLPLPRIEHWEYLQASLINTGLALGFSFHDAQDLAGETWLSLARNGKVPDDSIPLPMARAFVCQKLRWIAINKHRRTKPAPEALDDLVIDPPSPYPTPDELTDLRAALRLAVSKGGLDLVADAHDDGRTRVRRCHQRQTLRAQLPA